MKVKFFLTVSIVQPNTMWPKYLLKISSCFRIRVPSDRLWKTGKHGKWLKKIPCMLRLLDNLKSIRFHFGTEQSKTIFSSLYIKQDFSYLFNSLCNIFYFCLLYSFTWLKEGSMPYFEWSWKLNNRSWNYHGKIMEFYFVFSVGTLQGMGRNYVLPNL